MQTRYPNASRQSIKHSLNNKKFKLVRTATLIMPIQIAYRCILFAIGGFLVSGSTQAMPLQVEQTKRSKSPITNSISPATSSTTPQINPRTLPPVLGYGVGTFSVGRKLFSTDFSDSSQWMIQVEQNGEPLKEKIKFGDGMLDLYMPARGCTAWLRKKFEGAIMITYQVRCPLQTLRFPEIQARDINNFWNCSGDREEINLFDLKSFDGGFGSYSKMQGWYASTGGGGRKGNRTTRFRRYPREIDGKPCPHISLKNHDGQRKFLITPGKWHTIQLVAYQDIAQYIVDGVVVYQIREGDSVTIEVPPEQPDGVKKVEQRVYDTDEYPPYTEGYFGFRMVRSHHQYKNFSVHRLTPVAGPSD